MHSYQNFLSISFYLCSEWYGYHFPELIKIVNDNSTYCKLAKLIGNRKELSEEMLEAIEEITMDSGKAQAILDASRSSMGRSKIADVLLAWCEFVLDVMMFL